MPHDTSLIIAISAGVGLAFILGSLVARLKLPPLLGYLLAGLAVGPFTPGIVADGAVAHQLSELGVTLLMFGVGLHFSVRDLMAVRSLAIPGALAQIATATLLGLGAASLFGLRVGEGVIFGLCLSVASTVVLLRALESRGEIDSTNGRIAIGWLIVEDVVTIVAIVLMPVLAGLLGGNPTGPQDGLLRPLIEVLLKIAGFIGLMLIVGKRWLPCILGSVFRNGPRELFTVGVVAVALGLAFGAANLFGISPALGAFLAGVVLAESDLSNQTASEIKPLSIIFSVLFFVSIGMLFDPRVLVKFPLEVITGLVIVLLGKSLASAGILILFKHPLGSVLSISASLAQIGELSFILAGIGLSLGILSQSTVSIILAVGVISIAVNPMVFSLMDRLSLRISKRQQASEDKAISHAVENSDDSAPLGPDNHVILVGYGRVGRLIAHCLDQSKVPYVVIDFDKAVAKELENQGRSLVFGDATRTVELINAGINHARLLLVATPAHSLARHIIGAARSLRPDIKICVRTHSFEDYSFFDEERIHRTVMGELEMAIEMATFAFEVVGVDSATTSAVVERTRSLRQLPR